MFKGTNLQKAAILLAVIFVASAAIASFIYIAQYGFNFNGFNINSETTLSGDIKGGIKIDQEKTEPLQGLTDISAATVSENIRVIAADTNEVKVHYYGTYLSSNKDYKPELVIDRSGGSLKIAVRYNPVIIVGFNIRNNLKMDVYIPRQFAGNLKTASTSGEITTDSYTLESFTSKTTSGDLNAKLINAKQANIVTTSGETNINGSYDSFIFNSTSGNLISDAMYSKSSTIGSTSGEIKIAGAPGDVKANTVSGNVDLRYTEYSNKIDVRTTSGEVMIKLPDNPGFSLDFRSVSGNSECDFPITVTGRGDHNKLQGTVGSGAGSIIVHTTSGELKIAK